MKSDFKELVLTLIKPHGKGNPVYSAQLEDDLISNGATIRDAIRELRREGHPIANSKDGYFYAKNFDEIESTCEDLEKRAGSMLETSNKIRQRYNQPQLRINYE